jgi:hypothetical protein
VCAGLITLLVIIYQGNSSSLVWARSQVDLEVVFVGSLWVTSLIDEAHQSERCHLLCSARDRSDRSASPVWLVALGSSSFRGRKLEVSRPAYSPPSRQNQGPFKHKGFDSLTLLVVWSLWKERNCRVHERCALQPVALAPLILEEARRWSHAGFAGIISLGRLRL